jgi:hypothetical protein
LVVVLAVAGLGCSKRGPAPASHAPESGKYLPANPVGYLELDAQALFASSLIQPLRAKLLEQVPATCRPVAERAERLAVAIYGLPEEWFAGLLGGGAREDRRRGEASEPAAAEPAAPDVAVLFKGPAAAEVRACLEGLAKEGDEPIREEQRDGRQVLIGGRGGQFALVSPTDTVHVLCALPRLDAVLATIAGGPSIDDSELLKSLGTLPAGALVGALAVPESAATMMTEALAMFAGDRPMPLPRAVAFSLGLGESLVAAGSVTFTDAAGAQSLYELATGLIGAAKTAMALAGSDNPEVAPVKRMLDSLSLSRSGATLAGRISISADVLQLLL